MTLDQVLILFTLALFLGVGLRFRRQRPSTVESYALSHNCLGWFPIMAGISMTFAGGAAILNMTSVGYTFSWYALIDPLAVAAGTVVAILCFNAYRSNKGITVAHLLGAQHAGLAALIGLVSLFMFLLVLAAQFVALSKLTAPYFPDIDPLVLTTVFSAVVFSYVYFGGFSAVTRTDMLQLMLVMCFLVAPALFYLLVMDGGAAVNTAGSDVVSRVTTGAAENLSDGALSDGSPFRDPLFKVMPLDYILLFCVVALFIPLSQDVHLRIKSARNPAQGRIGLALGAVCYFTIVATVVYIGISMKVQGVELSDPELAYATFWREFFPFFGFLGIAGALAAIISTLDSYALNGVTSLAHDFFERIPFFQRLSRPMILYVAGGVIYAAALLIALFFQQILSLILLALLLYISTLLPVVVARVLGLKDRWLFWVLLLEILVICALEIGGIETSPKAIFYPLGAVVLVICAVLMQKKLSRFRKNSF